MAAAKMDTALEALHELAHQPDALRAHALRLVADLGEGAGALWYELGMVDGDPYPVRWMCHPRAMKLPLERQIDERIPWPSTDPRLPPKGWNRSFVLLSSVVTALRVSTGVDLAFTYIRVPAGFPIRACTSSRYDGEMHWEDASLFQMAIPANIGGHIGLGGFGSGNKWRGVVVGLAYAPSFTLTKADKGDAQTNFNWAGFELTLDVTSLEAAVAGYTKPAHFRLAFFVLPPVKNDMPLIGSVSFGAVWY